MLRQRKWAVKTAKTDVDLNDIILPSDTFSTLVVVPAAPAVTPSVRIVALGSGTETLHLKSEAEHFLVHRVPAATVVS